MLEALISSTIPLMGEIIGKQPLMCHSSSKRPPFLASLCQNLLFKYHCWQNKDKLILWRERNHFNHSSPFSPPHLCFLKFPSCQPFCVRSSFSSFFFPRVCRADPFDLLVRQMDSCVSHIQARIGVNVWHLAPLWAPIKRIHH